MICLWHSIKCCYLVGWMELNAPGGPGMPLQSLHTSTRLQNLGFNRDLGYGSVCSGIFCLPKSRSESAKKCGSTDPDPRGKLKSKTLIKNELLSRPKSARDIIKFQHQIMDPDPFFTERIRIRIKVK